MKDYRKVTNHIKLLKANSDYFLKSLCEFTESMGVDSFNRSALFIESELLRRVTGLEIKDLIDYTGVVCIIELSENIKYVSGQEVKIFLKQTATLEIVDHGKKKAFERKEEIKEKTGDGILASFYKYCFKLGMVKE